MPNCKRREKTSPHVLSLFHTHGNTQYSMVPYKKPRKSPGTETVKSLKKEVWDIFSEYRRRKYSNQYGICKCVTCGTIGHYKTMDAGHFIHGTSFLIEEMVHVQCKQCNGFKAGMAIEYRKFMVNTYGEDRVLMLERAAKKPHRYSIWELKLFKETYLRKLKELPEYQESKG
jgi:hypothetical protein